MIQDTQKEYHHNDDSDISDFWSDTKRLFGMEKDRSVLKAVLGLPEEKSFPEGIESSIWFNALYGFLDGISVVYSTIKFSCELVSPTSKDYHENLDHVLSDPEFWLPMIIAITFSAATFSVLGNYASKKDEADRYSIEKLCLAYLPYVRDILKGAKNGYKAIKTLVMVAVSHHLLDPANIRLASLPLGLAFAITAVFNRCFIRNIDDQQKALGDKFKVKAKEIHKAHSIQQKILKLQTQLLDIDIALKPVRYQLDELEFRKVSEKDIDKYSQETIDKAESYRKRENELLAQPNDFISQIHAYKDKLNLLNLGQYQSAEMQQLFKDEQALQEKYNYSYLFAKGLGGFIDAPYLYLGVMSLAVLNFAAFIFTSSILAIFVCICIAVRVHEGYCAQQKLSQLAMIAKLEIATNAFNAEQNNLLERQKSLYEEFIKNPLYEDYSESQLRELFEKELYQKEGSKIYKALHADVCALSKLYDEVDSICVDLQLSIMPTYWSAALHGMQDGLSAFGVLASTYFLLGIVLLTLGQAFPAALIVGGAVLGLVGIICAVGIRLWQAKNEITKRTGYYDEWKEYITSTIGDQYGKLENTSALLLSPIDINTDFLTKGEFFAQGLFEIARNFLNSPYKAENLTSFFLNQIDSNRHSTLISGFWAVLGIIYCAVLTLRAIGKTSKDKPVNFANEAEEKAKEKANSIEAKKTIQKTEEVTKEKIKPGRKPPSSPPPDGLACLHFNFWAKPEKEENIAPAPLIGPLLVL